MSLVFLMLAGVSALTGDWREFTGTTIQTLMISELIGIFLWHTALFDSLERLDSNRSAVIFALNVPRTVFPGWFLLKEHLGALTLLCCGLVFAGVLIAILVEEVTENRKEWIQHMDVCVLDHHRYPPSSHDIVGAIVTLVGIAFITFAWN